MDISKLYNDLYIRILVGALILASSEFLTLVKGVRKKIDEIMKNELYLIEKEFDKSTLNSKDIILMYGKLSVVEPKLETITNFVTMNIWSGICFFGACIFGFIQEWTDGTPGLAVIYIILTGVFFLFSFCYMFYWQFTIKS